MSDSDDYGDEFNDTEIFNVATQAEKENTPAFQTSPRPTKRRKFGHGNEKVVSRTNGEQLINKRRPFIVSDDDESEGSDDSIPEDVFTRPSKSVDRNQLRQNENHVAHEGDESPARETAAQKRKNRIHVPTTNLELTDVFYTQPPQEDSPPWKPRGAIWAKQTTKIGVHRPSERTKWIGLDAMKTISIPGRQSISSRPQPPISPAKSPSPIDLADSPALPNRSRPAEYDFTQDLADLPSDAFASSSSSPQKPSGDNVVNYAQKRVVAPTTGLRQTTLLHGRFDANGEVPASQVNKRYNFIADQKREPPTHHKLDAEAMKTWVYPTNLGTIRDYQFNIVQRGLFNNLLVALPTGLGKTFIAATIMLNWFRWTTEAQIVFVAPTKPLVSQQVEACFGIAGIPRSYTTMLTGGVTTGVRSEEWKCKRVFFMTPQTFLNDLKHGYADPKKIVLLVVDEAHRATGAYAYVEVVSFLRRFNNSFRVLALTATPGADVEAVQKVIDGLDISRVEIRTENSMDICRYVHQKKIEKHVFQNSDEMEMCMELYSQALQPLVSKIAGLNAYWSSNPLDLTPYGCQQAKKKFFMDAGRSLAPPVKNMVNAIFTILSSISHSMDLLKFHGIGPFYVKLKDFRDESDKGKSKYKKQILESDAFKKLMVRLQSWVGNDNFVGHPKLEFLQQVILDHFVNAGNGDVADGAPPSQTRIMVFAHFRDSAEEISRILSRHKPMIRPRVFLGQASGKNSEGMSQKEQLEVIQQFKDGKYNTLIATSIGEEGLDIGEVDLIILYDSKASPIRMLQRMGRTGRKREGKIVMLQMQGKEENDAIKAKDSYEKMQDIIANGTQFNFHDEISRRILPPDVRPVVDRRVVEIPLENSQQDFLPEPKKRGRAKKPPKVFHMPDGVLTGFVKAGRMDEEIAPKPRAKKSAVPVYSSEGPCDIPPLEAVLLDEYATKDLTRRFSTIYDDDDTLMVAPLDFSRHSEFQRTLTRPQLLSTPGQKTREFVGMMRRIRQVDEDRLDTFKRNLHRSDCESDSEHNIIASDAESRPEIHEDMWADDDDNVPAKPKQAKSKTKTSVSTKPEAKPKSKAAPKTAPRAAPKGKVLTTPKKPPGRPRKEPAAIETPLRVEEDDEHPTPRTNTPNWRTSGLAQEGEESSPPPTDPRFHLASQADTIGSDDTMGADEAQDPNAYKQDSELASFIVEDEDDVEVPTSSLPNIDMSGGLGKSTQAIVRAARPKRAPRREKIFTSDPTDDDAIVSSDSDDYEPIVKPRLSVSNKPAFVVDSASEDEDEDDVPVIPKKRVRRVIEDDEDE